MATEGRESSLTHRVNYSEVDQMAVVYHARYLVWFEMARTEYLRETGVSYRQLEEAGFRLVVAEARVRYLQPARYDDLVLIRCWIRDRGSRRITFGYAVENAATQALLVTGSTSLVGLNHNFQPSRLPSQVLQTLNPLPDPVRI